VALAGCALSVILSPANVARATGGGTPQKQISVVTYVSPKLPVRLVSAKASKVADRKPVLTYTAASHAGEQLDRLHFVAFVVGQDGRVKAGEGWVIDEGLAAHASVEIPISLKHNVATGEHLILSVWKAEGRANTFEAEPAEVVQSIQSGIANGERITAGAQIVRAAARSLNDKCTAGQSFATSSCKCGVKTFACDPTTGNFSFTCMTKEEGFCPAGGGETE
jgi:hypothetical protein